jgi:hypothetical protein
MRRTAYLPQRLQEGHIRFPGTVLLNALPTANPRRLGSSYLREKGIHQRRFANTRLAGHKHDLWRALER